MLVLLYGVGSDRAVVAANGEREQLLFLVRAGMPRAPDRPDDRYAVSLPIRAISCVGEARSHSQVWSRTGIQIQVGTFVEVNSTFPDPDNKDELLPWVACIVASERDRKKGAISLSLRW